jgi:hypothetical protein
LQPARAEWMRRVQLLALPQAAIAVVLPAGWTQFQRMQSQTPLDWSSFGWLLEIWGNLISGNR